MTAGPAADSPIESVVRRDRLVVAVGLAGVALLAWIYIAHLAGAMPAHDAMAMPDPGGWSPAEVGWLVVMWIVMMIAMMVPSAAPAILLFSSVSRRREARGVAAASTALFTSGYLLIWAVYATLAALAQWGLHSAALLSPAMASASPYLGAALLIGAGIFQWLPIKHACLHHCRSPLGFFASGWREGKQGALLMGMHHGTYCVACCALLMALLFVAGVMNLLWVAALSILVLVERVAPHGAGVGRAAGVGMIAWGIWLLLAG